MMKYKAFIFDLDGTLLDTIKDIADSANKVLAEMGGGAYSVEEYKTFVGKGFHYLFKNILPSGTSSEEIEGYCQLFKKFYQDNWNNKSKPYPQIQEVLNTLKKQDCKLAVLSNKQDHYTRQCVEYFFNNDLFDCYFGEREGVTRKPDPQGIFQICDLLQIPLNKTCFVGDSSIDMQAGNNAGVFTIGVSWGYRSVEELRQNKADVVIESPLELLDYAGIN